MDLMARDRKLIGNCPKCSSDQLACSYNHFESDDLTIHAWEHKCPDCGYRETTAHRSDEADDPPADFDPCVCPYCGRQAG